jgi:hypothetical protein
LHDCFFIFHVDLVGYMMQGTARCDFPFGSAKALFDSIHVKLFNLPLDSVLFIGYSFLFFFQLVLKTPMFFLGHDYPPSEREIGPHPYATVEKQRTENKHVKIGTELETFKVWREVRH